MQTHSGKSLSYGMTRSGVMVQIHLLEPLDAEWDEMIEAIRADRDKLLGIVVVGFGGGMPSAAQRQSVSHLAKTYPKTFRGVVLLTDSVLLRAALNGIAWLIPGIRNVAFGIDQLQRAVDFLQLDLVQAQEVRQLIAQLHPEHKIAV